VIRPSTPYIHARLQSSNLHCRRMYVEAQSIFEITDHFSLHFQSKPGSFCCVYSENQKVQAHLSADENVFIRSRWPADMAVTFCLRAPLTMYNLVFPASVWGESYISFLSNRTTILWICFLIGAKGTRDGGKCKQRLQPSDVRTQHRNFPSLKSADLLRQFVSLTLRIICRSSGGELHILWHLYLREFSKEEAYVLNS
jgi:hypothetical protein